MTFFVFGKGDDICLPDFHPFAPNPLGEHVFLSHPTYDVLFSPTGFTIPLQVNGILLSDIVTPPHPLFKTLFDGKGLSADFEFVTVTDDAKIWKIKAVEFEDTTDQLTLRVAEIRVPQKGWWLTAHSTTDRIDIKEMLGFLANDPNVDQVNEYYTKFHEGKDLIWMKRTVIAETAKLFQENEKLKKELERLQKIAGELETKQETDTDPVVALVS